MLHQPVQIHPGLAVIVYTKVNPGKYCLTYKLKCTMHNKHPRKNGWSYIQCPTYYQKETKIRLICCPLQATI